MIPAAAAVREIRQLELRHDKPLIIKLEAKAHVSNSASKTDSSSVSCRCGMKPPVA